MQRKGASEQRSFQRHSQPLSNWAYVRKGGFLSSAVAAEKKRGSCVTNCIHNCVTNCIANCVTNCVADCVTNWVPRSLEEFHVMILRKRLVSAAFRMSVSQRGGLFRSAVAAE